MEQHARFTGEESEARRDEDTASSLYEGVGPTPELTALRLTSPQSLQFPSSLHLPFALILWCMGLTPGVVQAHPDRAGALVSLDNPPGHKS